MTYRTEGVILAKRPYREYDRLYTLYTRERGKIQILAKGVRKSSSKLAGHLELLNSASFLIARGKQLDRIASLDVHDSCEEVKNSLEKLSCVLYGIELFDQIVKWEEPDEALFFLVTDFVGGVRGLEQQWKRSSYVSLFICKLFFLLGHHVPLEGGEKQLERLKIERMNNSVFSSRLVLFERCASLLLASHSERPLQSRAYFDFLQSASTKTQDIPHFA